MNTMNDVTTLTTDSNSGIEAINRQRRIFQHWKTASLSTYLEYKKRMFEDSLIAFNGIGEDFQHCFSKNQYNQLLPHLLLDESEIHRRNGGYWASLQGSSFVVNPGKNFLDQFSNDGFHIWDIDHVIITDASLAASYDLMRIYSLNKEVNALLRQWNLPPHIIRYLLHRDAHTKFSHLLRPTCREEKSSVEMLPTFSDSHSYESARLGENIVMEYAANCPTDSSIMLRFSSKEQLPALGFTTQTCQQKQAPFLESCQTLLIGAGKIDLQGLSKDGLLGLLQEVQCPLALISEIDFSEGDMRIESLRALKERLSTSSITLLPCEIGLNLNLSSHTMTGPGLANSISVDQVRTARSHGAFSCLQYLENSCLF